MQKVALKLAWLSYVSGAVYLDNSVIKQLSVDSDKILFTHPAKTFRQISTPKNPFDHKLCIASRLLGLRLKVLNTQSHFCLNRKKKKKLKAHWSTTLQLILDIYGRVTQLALQIFRGGRMSTTFRSYTHFTVRGQHALTPSRCFLRCWTERCFQLNYCQNITWTSPLTAQGVYYGDGAVHCAF